MNENGFKKLQEEDEQHFQKHFSGQVQQNVESTLGIFRIIGQFIDLYLSKLFTFLVVFMEDQSKAKTPEAGNASPPDTNDAMGTGEKATPDIP